MSVELSGLDKVLADIDKIGNVGKPNQQFQQKAAAIMLADVDDNFQTAGFGGWKALDPDTIKRKHNSRILEASGKYRRSVKPEFVGNEIRVKSGVYYSRFHQLGEGGVPKRAITLSQKAQDAISELFRRIVGVQSSSR